MAATAPRSNRRTGPTAGDATAMKAAALAEAAEKAAKERAEEAAEKAAAEQKSLGNDVIDPSTGEVVGTLDLGVNLEEADATTDEELFEELRGSDDTRVQRLLARFAQAKAREEQEIQSYVEAGDNYVIIKTVENVKNMTWGAGNTLNFEKGKQYKVERALAKELDRCGLIWH